MKPTIIIPVVMTAAFLWLHNGFEARAGEWEYVVEDKVGYFKTLMDGSRLLNVTWRGIPFLANAGEYYWPVHYGRWFLKEEQVREICGWYNFPRDLPLCIERGENSVEYRWQCADADKGFVQINRMKAEKDTLVLETEIQFTNSKNMPKEVVFHPVFFPGVSASYNRAQADYRLRGKEQRLLNKDGSVYTMIYPNIGEQIEVKKLKEGELEPVAIYKQKMNVPFKWAKNVRGVLFGVGKDKKIGVMFSCKDENTEISFWGNVPSPDTLGGVRDVVASEIVFKPRGETYTNIIRMEIKGDIKDFWKAGEPESIELASEVAVKADGDQVYNIFYEDEPVTFKVKAQELAGRKRSSLNAEYILRDWNNKEVARENRNVGAEREWTYALKDLPRGTYSLEIRMTEENKLVGIAFKRLGIVPQPYKIKSEDAFFGANFFGSSFPLIQEKDGSMPECNKKFLDVWAKMAYKLGVKMIRWGDWNIKGLKRFEPEEGKFVFKKASDECIDILRTNGLAVWMTSFDDYNEFPEWARGEETNYHLVKGYLPKDYSIYEKWLYEVAKHFKGRIYGYELDNEPPPEQMDPKVKAKLLEAGYKGIKQGDPDAKVLGCAVTGVERGEALKWFEDVLFVNGGAKYIEIITPHYLSTGPNPESGRNAQTIPKLIEICKRGNLGLWNGEAAGNLHMASYTEETKKNVFPERYFTDLEKKIVSLSVRSYLVQLSFPELRHVSPCHDAGHFEYDEECGIERYHFMMSDYRVRYIGASFFKMGHNVSGWGVAHAFLASLLEGSRFRERVNLGDDKLYCHVHERDKETIVALWMTAGTNQFEVDFGRKKVEKFNVVGTPEILTGKITLKVSNEPFYLKVKGNGKFLIETLKKGAKSIERCLDINAVYRDKDTVCVMLQNKSDREVDVSKMRFIFGDERREEAIGKIGPSEAVKKTFTVKADRGSYKVECEREGVVEEGSGSLEYYDMKKAVSGGYIPVARRKGVITIDGKLNEPDWGNAYKIRLDKEDQLTCHDDQTLKRGGVTTNEIRWKGKEDLSCDGYLLWDEENLYLGFKVYDDQLVNNKEGENSWNGDSLQIVMDTKNDTPANSYLDWNDMEIGLSYKVTKPWGRNFGNDRIKRTPWIETAEFKWIRGEGYTEYELRVPVKELYPLCAGIGNKVRFNFIVNEDDGKGRWSWMGLTGGIGEKKDPTLYKEIIFVGE